MSPAATILFAGGGTGGHLFPGIALAEELRRRDATTRSVFVGSERTIEATIAAEHHLEHRILSVESLLTLKRNPWRFVSRSWQAWRNASRLLSELKPSAVIGLGGFASAPLVWEAKRHGIPIILLEQNVIPGKTTRWLSRYADFVCVSFNETISRLASARSVIVTGTPVRSQIASIASTNLAFVGGNSTSVVQPELLILGGSQGAESLNEAVVTTVQQLKALFDDWKIVHQTGPRDVNRVRQAYQQIGAKADVEPFFNNLSSYLATASLVVSRAGATSLAELACAGLPMILLPYPFAAEDHQRANAQYFVDHHAAMMVTHGKTPDLTANDLRPVLENLIRNQQQRQTMGRFAQSLALPNAANQIANIILDVIDQRRGKSAYDSEVR
jgi:UDP-N-acetylglucosamine--N-acetylmuramyl-(pentapeptide) pyrophosphoryl-undecaprenol N-acetylglucosamine transferase